jgi:protein phosphatase
VPDAIPSDALVLLMGPSGAGKSSYARRHFPPAAVLASDVYRARISGSEANQGVTAEAFRQLHRDAEVRLAAGELTVIDATNVLRDSRRPLLELAERHRRPVVALVLETPLAQCLAWNAARPGRMVPPAVVRRQHGQLQRALPGLEGEGFDLVLRVASSDAEADR